MAHLEFGQDRLAQPHSLQTFELAQRPVERPVEACCVRALERSRCSRASQLLAPPVDPKLLGRFSIPP